VGEAAGAVVRRVWFALVLRCVLVPSLFVCASILAPFMGRYMRTGHEQVGAHRGLTPPLTPPRHVTSSHMTSTLFRPHQLHRRLRVCVSTSSRRTSSYPGAFVERPIRPLSTATMRRTSGKASLVPRYSARFLRALRSRCGVSSSYFCQRSWFAVTYTGSARTFYLIFSCVMPGFLTDADELCTAMS
jgi:hypothetical protein